MLDKAFQFLCCKKVNDLLHPCQNLIKSCDEVILETIIWMISARKQFNWLTNLLHPFLMIINKNNLKFQLTQQLAKTNIKFIKRP